MFLVDPKYHKLIFQGVKSFSNLVKTGSNLHVIIIFIIYKFSFSLFSHYTMSTCKQFLN